MTPRGTVEDLRRIAAWGDPGVVPPLASQLVDAEAIPLAPIATDREGQRTRVLAAAALVVVLLAGVVYVTGTASGGPVAAARGTWSAMAPAPLGPRVQPAAVWTGSEMVVFGGQTASGQALDDGAAYDPTTDTWRRIARYPYGYARTFSPGGLAVWTGREMLTFVATARVGTKQMWDYALVAYDPAKDSWRKVFDATFDQPVPNSEIFPRAPVPIDGPEAAAWIEGALVVVGYDSHTGEYEWVRVDVDHQRWGQRHLLPGAGENYLLTKTFASDGRRVLFTREGYSSFVAKSYLIDPVRGTTTIVDPPHFPNDGRAELWFGRLSVTAGRFTRVGYVGNIHGGSHLVAYVLEARPTLRWVERTAPSELSTEDDGVQTVVGTPYGAFMLGGLEINGRAGATRIVSDGDLRRWSTLPEPPIDLHRLDPVALWTGRDLLIWGGAAASVPDHAADTALSDGARWQVSAERSGL